MTFTPHPTPPPLLHILTLFSPYPIKVSTSSHLAVMIRTLYSNCGTSDLPLPFPLPHCKVDWLECRRIWRWTSSKRCLHYRAVFPIATNNVVALHVVTLNAMHLFPSYLCALLLFYIIYLYTLCHIANTPTHTILSSSRLSSCRVSSGHTEGILSVSWCPTDPSLLLSCGKDNKTMMWDLLHFAPVFDLPSGNVASERAMWLFVMTESLHTLPLTLQRQWTLFLKHLNLLQAIP